MAPADQVIDVSSVTIFPTCFPCAVYGYISVYDRLDSTLPTYELYQRDAQHAELISEPGQALSVVCLDNVLLFRHPVLAFNLKVKDTTAEDDNNDDANFIARGTVNLDFETNNDYEQVKELDVKGDCGKATVNYVAMSCALVARLDVHLHHHHFVAIPDDDLQRYDSKSCLYGSIVVHYDNTFGHIDHFRIQLLDVPSDQTIPLFFDGNYRRPAVKLTRNYLAVPAYSSLNVTANVKSTLSNKSVVDEEETIILWPPNEGVFSDSSMPPRCVSVFWTTINWMSLSIVQSRYGHTKRRKSGSYLGEILLEVFSVFIGRENDHNLNVSGTITLELLQPFDPEVVIFKRGDTNPDRLVDGRKLLAITCPSIIEFDSLCTVLTIDVKLEDANRRFLIEGCVDFDTIRNHEPDTPLCSVISGRNGYCALHYTVFESAAMLSLKIILLCKGVAVATVHGKIVAWSDMFDYTRDYNKKYYRRVLYDEPKAQIYYPQNAAPKKTFQNFLDEHEYGEVELLESCVAMPVDYSFNIGVDLYASSHTGSGLPEHLNKTLQFWYDGDKQRKEIYISGEDFVLCVQYV